MKNFDVYPVYPIEIVRGKGSWVYDRSGEKYLDFYGGHAVISVGHSHPRYVQAITDQVAKLGFYSNSIENPLQTELASLLGSMSGCDDYDLFLVNSGAEANENAIKLASFHNGKTDVISFKRAFHGRTSAAVNVTDNDSIKAPVNRGFNNIVLEMEDIDALEKHASTGSVSSIIIEGIQGIAGIYSPTQDFLRACRRIADQYDIVLIMDEIQSGYGRSGDFFAFQQVPDLMPDIITVAKGMGNGFPIGGVLISAKFEARYGLLGTTFGGNHLACAAAIAVLEIIQEENLVTHSKKMGTYLMEELSKMDTIKNLRGRGLMIGIELPFAIKDLRKNLLFDHHVFVGSAADPHTIRLLPPLNISREEADICLQKFNLALKNTMTHA